MDFKVKAPLMNVRPAKTDKAELTVSTTKGTMRINAPAVKLTGFEPKQFALIVPVETAEGEFFFLTAGHAGNESTKTSQSGSIMASSNKDGSGSLQFGSGNAWKELGGNEEDKMIYNIEDAFNYEGVDYYKLVLSHKEPKTSRVKKEKEVETHDQGMQG